MALGIPPGPVTKIGIGGVGGSGIRAYGTRGPPPGGTIIGTGGPPGVRDTKIGIAGGAIGVYVIGGGAMYGTRGPPPGGIIIAFGPAGPYMRIGIGGGAPIPVSVYGTSGPPPIGTIIGTGGPPPSAATIIGMGGFIIGMPIADMSDSLSISVISRSPYIMSVGLSGISKSSPYTSSRVSGASINSGISGFSGSGPSSP